MTVVLSNVPQVGRQFHAGNYRELPTGEALADDLNGYSLLYRPNASMGTSAADWTQIDMPNQILDMTLTQIRDRFIAGGSRNVEPPRVFLPPTNPVGDPRQFERFAPPTDNNWGGEIWGVAASDDCLYAVGERQPLSSNTGLVLLSTDDDRVPPAVVWPVSRGGTSGLPRRGETPCS